jgi:L-fuculose-phosphate aldolase
MANHGAVVHAGDAPAAVESALLLEWACDVYWRAAAMGAPRVLDEDDRAAVVAAAVTRGYGTTKPIGEAEA